MYVLHFRSLLSLNGCMGATNSKNSSPCKKSRKSLTNQNTSSDDEPDGTANHQEVGQSSRKGSKKKDKKMPLFRHQSEQAKKRQHHQQYLVGNEVYIPKQTLWNGLRYWTTMYFKLINFTTSFFLFLFLDIIDIFHVQKY